MLFRSRLEQHDVRADPRIVDGDAILGDTGPGLARLAHQREDGTVGGQQVAELRAAEMDGRVLKELFGRRVDVDDSIAGRDHENGIR